MRLLSVNVAHVQPPLVGGRTVAGAVGKRALPGPVAVRPLGLEGAVREPRTIAAGQPFTVEPGPREVRIDELFRARTAARH